MSSVALRVTTVLRREDGGWKIVHRPADPITTTQPTESADPARHGVARHSLSRSIIAMVLRAPIIPNPKIRLVRS